MRLLLIISLPPPITGQAVASLALYNHLKNNYDVDVINLSKNSLQQGISSFSRFIEVIKIFYNIYRKSNLADVIYLNNSQSKAGVLRDIIIFFLVRNNISKVIVHSHGNGIKKIVYDDSYILKFLSTIFLKKIKKLIILGPSGLKVYKDIISKDQLYIVYNFANDELFLSEKRVISKHRNINSDFRLNILFLSNLIPGKGYIELVNAYKSLNNDIKNNIQITFAGNFVKQYDKNVFEESIHEYDNLVYFGLADAHQKKLLLNNSNVFCLPTYYEYEGQPISILEAYAAGCAVITTNHAGIGDIFSNKINGIYVDKRSVISLANAIKELYNNHNQILQYAITNNKLAHKKFREEIFCSKIESIFLNT